MRINYRNQDFQIINKNRGYSCNSCEFASRDYNIPWCVLFCHVGKIWIKDICNSDIFEL